MPGRYVLDTNIFTPILRHEVQIGQRVSEALAAKNEFLLCPVVFYEVCRGLIHRNARNQLAFFLNYTTTFTWDDFNQADWQQAAQLWADLRRQGQQISDADLLIGVYALQRQATIITDNQKDFEILRVNIENWRR